MHERDRARNGGAVPEADRLTLLTSFGPPATKVLGPDPDTGRPAVVAGYGDAAHFRVGSLPARTPEELAAALRFLDGQPRSFVIRGEPLPGTDLAHCRRLLHPSRTDDGTVAPATFRDAARRWAALDVDGVPVPDGLDWIGDPVAAAAYVRARLRREFHDAACVIQATASAGVKPGIRARIWFLLDRAVTGVELKQLLRDAPVDLALCGPVQPCYTAKPVFHGIRDPMPWRLRLVPGARERVAVPALPEPGKPPWPPAPPERHDGSRYALAALARETATVAAVPVGERHAALNRAGFALARFVRTGELAAVEVVAALVAAARGAGLDDPDAELRRFLRCGLRAGLERAGL